MKQALITLDIRQQRTVIPERWGTNEVSPMIASAYYIGRVSKTRRSTEAEIHAEPGNLPGVEDRVWSPGR